MKLTITTCWSRVIYLMTVGPVLEHAIYSINVTKGPNFEHEGMAGYIETQVEIQIKDLKKFTDLYESWNNLTSTQKLNLYGLAKGLGDRK